MRLKKNSYLASKRTKSHLRGVFYYQTATPAVKIQKGLIVRYEDVKEGSMYFYGKQSGRGIKREVEARMRILRYLDEAERNGEE